MKFGPEKKKRFIALTAALMISWVLYGCGKDESLEVYKESMDGYYEQVALIDAGINSIDPVSDIDGTQLLGYLDELNLITADMAELEVPSQFEIVESLADEASENLNEAVNLYHQLYSGDYNEDLAAGAYEYYERANMRIRYIKDILHGDMPEDLVVVSDEYESGTGE